MRNKLAAFEVFFPYWDIVYTYLSHCYLYISVFLVQVITRGNKKEDSEASHKKKCGVENISEI